MRVAFGVNWQGEEANGAHQATSGSLVSGPPASCDRLTLTGLASKTAVF